MSDAPNRNFPVAPISPEQKGESDREKLAKAERGERITAVYSMFAEVQPHAATCRHSWRVIVCTSDLDVCECRSCGTQRVMACNFDEDMS